MSTRAMHQGNRAMKDRIKQLEAENVKAKDERGCLVSDENGPTPLGETIFRLERELAECRKDAERYRWIINNATTVRVQGGECILTKNFDNMTKHIDRAIKEAR